MSSDLGIMMFMPTRGRAKQAKAAYDAAIGDARLGIAPILDAEDKEWGRYINEFRGTLLRYSTGSMVKRTNDVVMDYINHPLERATVIGWMADDTLFRQKDWVQRVLLHFIRDDALLLTVNDGHLDRERPQSAMFMRYDVVRALGWLALPTQQHLYIDNAWADLRDAIGEYGHHDSDILAEHMHPYIEKGQWDEQYLDIHKQEKYDIDGPAYRKWKAEQFPYDVGRVMSCL